MTIFNLKRREFSVRGKGQKDRPIFISPEAADCIQHYLDKRERQYTAVICPDYSGSKKLMSTAIFTRLTARSIQRMVSRYALLSGITETLSVTLPDGKTFFRDFNLLMNGADIRSVQAARP